MFPHLYSLRSIIVYVYIRIGCEYNNNIIIVCMSGHYYGVRAGQDVFDTTMHYISHKIVNHQCTDSIIIIMYIQNSN